MKLRMPPFSDVLGAALYFVIQAGHRKSAIDHAIEVIREDAARATGSLNEDPILAELEKSIARG